MKNYAWYDGLGFQMPHGDSILDGTFIDQHVRQAVGRDLERKEGQNPDAVAREINREVGELLSHFPPSGGQ